MRRNLSYISALIFAISAQAQVNYYAMSTLAGNFVAGDGQAAANALLASPLGAAVDKGGNIFFIDQRDSSIRTISPAGIISTLAIVPDAIDLAPDRLTGDLIVATTRTLHRVTAAGQVTQLAGGRSEGSSGDGGPAVNALVSPYSVTVDPNGTIYFAEAYHDRVRKIATDGTITTFAGTGTFGFSGDGFAANQAKLDFPDGVAADAAGFVYISDYFNGRIRRVTPAGIIATYAGNGFLGQPADGSIGPNTRFGGFGNLSLDGDGNLLICDTYYNMVFRISSGGSVRVLAGTGVTGFAGDGASGRSALLDSPYGVAALADGSVIIADARNDRIRKVAASDGRISTIAGRNHFAGDNGPALQATLNRPSSVARDSKGQVYVSDRGNNRIRRIDVDGTIRTIAGTGKRAADGDNGPATTANLNAPLQIITAPDDTLYFIDSGNMKVRKITPAGIITTVAGSGDKGDTGDGGPATAARFQSLTGIALDKRGNLFISDGTSNKIRRVILGSGVIDTYAGGGPDFGEGGLATAAKLGYPADLATDARDRLYMAEISNGIIRRIETNGIISTFAGNRSQVGPSEGALAKDTGIGLNSGLAFDGSGNLLLLSLIPSRVYSISAASGAITTIAGGGPSEALGDGGSSLAASLTNALALTTAPDGSIYIADSGNDRVRKLTLNNPAKLEITGGNNQQGGTGQTATEALRVKLTGSASVGIPSVVVNFRVLSGSATLSSPTTLTDATGTAGVGVTFGAAPGAVQVEASVVGVTAAVFNLTAGSGTTGGGPGLPVISSVISAGAFGGKAAVASGDWLEIYGVNLSAETREWAGADFNGDTAPTALGAVRVRVNGQPAFIRFISSGQINVQAPAGITAGTATVDVTTAAGTSAAFSVASATRVPSLLAPPSFTAAGKQFIVGLLSDGAYVGKTGLVPGLSFRPLKAGDRVVLYGIGFGDVTPAILPGQIARTASAIPNISIRIGGVDATVEYAGLAGGFLGLYQFNVVAPAGLAGDQRVEVSAGGTSVANELWITYDATASSSDVPAPQMNDRFQVRSLREQVGQYKPLDRVTGSEKLR